MLLGRYTFYLTFDDDAALPEYKGSTFRGIFGHALKRVVCALKQQECADCLLREKCLYFQVFEVQRTVQEGSAGEGRKRVAAPPHPYVIEPSDNPKTRYAAGETLDVTLLLFGGFNDSLPYFIYAFNEMGKLGIGKSLNGRRAFFHLERVVSDGKPVYDQAEKKILNGSFAEDISLGEPTTTEVKNAAGSVTIRLQTPLRLKFENHLRAELPFHLLVRAMLRRISSLEDALGAGEPRLDYRGLVERAKNVAVERSAIRWFDWKRYSNRQDQQMLMGGMIGEITYAGDLGPFLPLVHYCEKVHLGKGTTFGLGRMSGSNLYS